jgi:glutamate racemase
MFDSGIGGLAVLRELRRLESDIDVLYVADQAWAPYGERSLAEVRSRAVAITTALIAHGASPIVVACNSASAAALHPLRDRFSDVAFVGMEPAVKPATERTRRGVIGVLATDATFQGELYASVVRRFANGSRVVGQACPGLAVAIEAGADGATTGSLARRYVEPLLTAGVDTIVVGCTHYSFITPTLRQIAGSDVEVIDPVVAVARQVLRLLDEIPRGKVWYRTTGDARRFAEQVRNLMYEDVEVEPLEVGAWA